MTGASKFKTGYLTLTTPTRGQFVNPMLTLDILYLYTKFNDSLQPFQRYDYGPRK